MRTVLSVILIVVINHLVKRKGGAAQGAIIFFLSSVVCILLPLIIVDTRSVNRYMFQCAVCIAFILMLVQLLSSRWLQDVLITATAAVLGIIFIENHDPAYLNQLSNGIVLGTLIGAASYRFKFLDAGGSIATALLGSFIYGFGGWQWTLPMVCFFLFSSILSRVRSAVNKEVDIQFEKTGTRDALQVFSNGGIGGLLVILNYFFPSLLLFIMYCSAIAAVCADTWGTEIGTMYRTRTYNILNMREVIQGTSGAVSLPGTLGSFSGAMLISFISVLWISINFIPYFLIIFLSGVTGSIIDSILGAALQGSYKCTVCGMVTEKRIHCDTPSVLIKGHYWLNNDLVNITAAGAGGIFSIIFLYIFL